MSELKYKLEKLELNGTPEKKDIIILKFLDDVGEDQRNHLMALQAEINQLKAEADMKNVVFLMLPKHIHLMSLNDEQLDEIGLIRK